MITLVLLLLVAEGWATLDDEKRIRVCVGRDQVTGLKRVIGCWPADRCYCATAIFEAPRCDCEPIKPWPPLTSSPYIGPFKSPAEPQKKMQGWDPVHVLGIGGAILVVVTLTSIACCCGCRQWIKPSRISNVRSINVGSARSPKPPPYSLSPPPPYNGSARNQVQILNIQTNTTRVHSHATASRDNNISRDTNMTSRVYRNDAVDPQTVPLERGANNYPYNLQRQMNNAAREMNISSGSSISAIHVDPNERPQSITLAHSSGRPTGVRPSMGNISIHTERQRGEERRSVRSEGSTDLYLQDL